MTKANDAARAAVKDAERRARRKLARLRSKGIRTGSINPLHEVDPSNTRALKKYARELESFISRQTRFVAGRDGTPIPWSAYRDYKRIERQWNRAHDRFWANFADQPFITAFGESDMTIGQRSAAGHVKGAPYGDIGYRRGLMPDQIRSLSDLEKRQRILEKELSPSYQQKRVRQLRKNLMEHAESFNDPRVPRAIRSLTNEQLFALQNFTNFVPLYYRFIVSGDEGVGDRRADDMDREAQIEHMLLTVEQVKKAAPKKSHGKRRGKRRGK